MEKSKPIALPKGFLFSTAEAAIKKPGRKDLALICSETEAVMAGMFTTNKVKAAPVKLDMRKIRSGRGRAIIVNSGNANACSGEQGMRDAIEMAELAARPLKIKPGSVYVCSTGVIGTPMPMERIRPGIAVLAERLGTGTLGDVASAIMTTDTFPKVVTKRIRVGSSMVTLAGVCKGAGMICPNMATMLCFLMTDAAIEKTALNKALKSAVQRSFNRITIDGDMSTNDTVLLMANGRAGNETIGESSPAFGAFASALATVAYELAGMIVRDGEGATKFVEIELRNARSEAEAEKGAFALANSLLVKTALYGNDANWGRLMAALGRAGIQIREERVDILLNGVKVAARGMATGKDAAANEKLKSKEVRIVVDLHLGSGAAKVLTCDLTEEYVKINAEYRT
ncbi:MAG: bifunctional glutamate N-acetyltransferase/amino-acid acetyltransferase ArgJ [Alphaproteobacteria bacterium]|uniref:Arginine biosynthesis bifunctional protein ArgJ n=1 Tax=Candidatus Nitrobium versatile TaxID=2884831 RepID=A0A953M2R0_9BACT|nr:bifunctional glutamate N-acetyltransferase/amino-acid acetyltransferase ArgJ [Candidatus Nitrobium versatile]